MLKKGVTYDISAALIDTGSRMDEVILKNLKDGNSELILDRKVADKEFIQLLISLDQAQKRKLLFEKDDLSKMNVLRRLLARWVQWMELIFNC